MHRRDTVIRGVRPSVSGKSALLAGGALLASAIGAAAAIVPLQASLMLIVLLLAVPLVAIARRLVEFDPRGRSAGTAERARRPGSVSHADVAVADLRLPRLFYYGGVAFLAQLTMRPALSFTVSDTFFLASLGAVMVEIFIGRARLGGALPGLAIVGILVYSLGGLLSSTAAHEPVSSIVATVKFAYLTTVWFWLGTLVLQRREHVETAVLIWCLSAAASGAAAIAQLLWGDVIPNTTIEWGRMTGFAQHVNDLGGSMAVAWVPALMLSTRMGGTIRTRWIGYVCMLLIGAGLILSGSVGALLAALFGTAVWVSLGRLRVSSVGVLVIVALALFVLVDAQRAADAPSPLERFTSTTNRDENPNATLWTRMEANEAAIETIVRNPLVGVGLGYEGTVTEAGLRVHNLLLGTWFEAGLLGIAGMLTLIVAVLLAGGRAVAAARSNDESVLALALLISFMTYVVFAMSAPARFERYGWIAGALLLALWALQHSPISTTPPQRSSRRSWERSRGVRV